MVIWERLKEILLKFWKLWKHFEGIKVSGKIFDMFLRIRVFKES